MEARSPRYPALYDEHSGVRFQAGRAEVTEEQALKLAERRYVDGILIDEQPAKDWAKSRRRDTEAVDLEEAADSETVDEQTDAPDGTVPAPEPAILPPPVTEPTTEPAQGRKPRSK